MTAEETKEVIFAACEEQAREDQSIMEWCEKEGIDAETLASFLKTFSESNEEKLAMSMGFGIGWSACKAALSKAVAG